MRSDYNGTLSLLANNGGDSHQIMSRVFVVIFSEGILKHEKVYSTFLQGILVTAAWDVPTLGFFLYRFSL